MHYVWISFVNSQKKKLESTKYALCIRNDEVFSVEKIRMLFSLLTFQFSKTKHAMKPHGLLDYLWN